MLCKGSKAIQGNGKAQLCLGIFLYENYNYIEAVKWLKEAAKNHNHCPSRYMAEDFLKEHKENLKNYL